MDNEAEQYGDGSQGLDQLADLLLFAERLKEDPQAALQSAGLAGAIPDEVMTTLSGLSAEEMRLLAHAWRMQQQSALARSGSRYGIIF